MARKRASMREGPLAELFRATEAAQRQAEQAGSEPATTGRRQARAAASPSRSRPSAEPEVELPPAAIAPSRPRRPPRRSPSPTSTPRRACRTSRSPSRRSPSPSRAGPRRGARDALGRAAARAAAAPVGRAARRLAPPTWRSSASSASAAPG